MSQNIDGALAFKATLNIDDFNVSAEAMERRIRNVSTSSVYEAERMEQSIMSFAQNGAKYIVSYLVGNGMMSLVNSIVQTRGQFQQLNIAFETMLGSGSRSQALMNQLIETAAKTPFDLKGVAMGAKSLLAYGFEADKVNDTLIRLGNIASGLSIPLNDIVYLYGTTMTQGRLYAQDMRQFMGRGIPLAKELAEMYGKTTDEINAMVSAGKIGFSDVEKVMLKLTNQGGQFYNLMEKQSASLTGMIANLGDAWDMALNKIGQENEQVFAKGIEGATHLVENLDTVLNIVKAIAIAYGSYKAAIVVNTLATKGYTGIALVDNTVRQAKITLLKAESAAMGQNKEILERMTKAELENIYAIRQRITLEQHEQALRTIKSDALKEILNEEQLRYLSNKNLISGSTEYIREAESVLSVEQKMQLSKMNLTANSREYADTIKRMSKETDRTVNSLKNEANSITESIKVMTKHRDETEKMVEAARKNLLAVTESGKAKQIERAETKLSALQTSLDNQNKEINTAVTRRNTIEKKLSTIEAKRGTAVAVADIGTKAAQTTATNVLTSSTGRLTIAMRTLWASMKANPIGWVLSGVGLLISAFTMFGNKQKEAEQNAVSLSNATKKASDEFAQQASKIDTLVKIVNNSNISNNERNKALIKLKETIPGYNAMLDQEGKLLHNNTIAIDEYLKSLEKQIKMKAAQEELEAAYKKKRLEEKEAQEKISKGKSATYISGGSPTLGGAQYSTAYEDYTEAEAAEILRKATEKTTKTIDELNDEIKETSLSIDSSTKVTRTYSEQISDTQKNIANLKTEIKDMRSGKIVDNDLAKSIEEKTNELRAAESKLALLTGKQTGGKASGGKSLTSSDIQDEIVQSQIKVEQARIEIMEDGHEKRKAMMDLQYKQNLLAIDKEEKDLIKARTEAGKSLTDVEKSNFEERRSLEKQSYTKGQNKLFDDEISYKKQQYELYWRWVENMGADVAEKRFSSLMKDGASYKAYLENQQKSLNIKKNDGTMTDGEGNFLISINNQLDELSGKKSTLDQFKSNLDDAINRASTLAEKMQAVADAKALLESNKSNIIGDDDLANASMYLSQLDDENSKQIQQRLLDDFKSFEEKKTAILNEFNMLRVQKQVQSNQELLKRINKGEADALSALNAELLMQSDDWKNLFTNLDYLSATEIDKIISNIEGKLADANLKLNPADYKALIESLNEAKNELIERNPLKALGKSFNEYIANLRALKNAEKSNLSDDEIKKFEIAVKNSAKQVANSINEINGIVSTIGNALSGVAESFGGDELASDFSDITELFGSIAQTGGGVAKIISGDIVGGVKDLISGLANALQIFNRMHDKKKEREIQSLQKSVDSLTKSYEALGNEIEKAFGSGKAKLLEEENKLLEQRNIQIQKQIEAEKSKKKPDKDKIKAWEETIKESTDLINENINYKMIEAIFGTDVQDAISQFADAYAEAWTKGEKAAGKSANVVKNLIRNQIINELKNKLSKEVEAFMNLMKGYIENDGVIDDYEQGQIDIYEKRLEEMADKYLGGKEKWLQDGLTDKDIDPLTGAVRGMSEETGSLIAGKFNAFVINQADQTDVLRQSLVWQMETAQNTRHNVHLVEIMNSLKRIESKDSSLLSQGIGG